MYRPKGSGKTDYQAAFGENSYLLHLREQFLVIGGFYSSIPFSIMLVNSIAPDRHAMLSLLAQLKNTFLNYKNCKYYIGINCRNIGFSNRILI